MKAYWVARSKILDHIKCKKYTVQVPEIISKFGGKILARGGNFKILNEVSKYVDYKNIIACTNCGMTPMPYNIAEKNKSFSCWSKLIC